LQCASDMPAWFPACDFCDCGVTNLQFAGKIIANQR